MVVVEPPTSAPVRLPFLQPGLAAPAAAERPGPETVGMSGLRSMALWGSRVARVALGAPDESVMAAWAARPTVPLVGLRAVVRTEPPGWVIVGVPRV
jgi:hypothetical protein